MPNAPIGDLIELALLAERSGCSRCWVYDEGVGTRDVYVALAAIAGATSSIRIGPGITNPFTRHPGTTASAIATIDELSGGRAFLGLGAGGALTLAPLGIERRHPLAAVDATVSTVRSLMAGERVDHDGETFSFAGAHLDYGRADLEIIIAGRGPKMMALAGEKADGFYLSYAHKDTLADAIATVRHTPDAEGRSFSLTYSTMIAMNEAELEAARAQLTFRLIDSPADIKQRIGFTEGDAIAIRRALGEGGPAAAAAHIKPEWVPHFVISGSPAECAFELRSIMTDHRIDEFQLAVSDIERGAELIERTAALFGQD